MTKQHRYRQEALGEIPGADAKDYSPKGPESKTAPPEQGRLALDGGVLGPLFNKDQDQKPTTKTK